MAVMKDSMAVRKRLEKAKKNGTLAKALAENARIEEDTMKKLGLDKKKSQSKNKKK